MAYDLEVSKVGSDHLKTEPTVKRTTEFYHPKQNRDKTTAADAKLPGFFLDNGVSDNTMSKSDSYDQFNFWREPVMELEDITEDGDNDHKTEQLLDNINKFLLKRAFLCGFEVSSADFALLEIVQSYDLNEESHFNIIRWSQNIQSHDIIDYEDVDVDKILEMVANDGDFTIEQVMISEDDPESNNDDHGYDSDKENDEDIEEQEDDDDDDGWITPGNLKSKKAAIGNDCDTVVPDNVTVALMTTDFAMQNVCKQMGLNLIGTNGMLIQETKTWILRCTSCFKTTSIMEKKFCPKCGYQTLKRVSVTLNADGSQQIHISTRKPLSTRGKKFSLPAPKGGKHAWNPRLSEDQREPQQRLSKKAMLRNNPMGEDYLAGNSPFISRDVNSKAAMLGLAGQNRGNAQPSGFYWTQKNPNAVRKNTGNKKRNK